MPAETSGDPGPDRDPLTKILPTLVGLESRSRDHRKSLSTHIHEDDIPRGFVATLYFAGGRAKGYA